MAGAGGGPSRRSHTKSRKGCKTCKRRHIRCDETFPQCKNCSKHQVRCDYMENSSAADEGKMSSQANLNWTPEIEKTVDLWRQTGQFPFPDLQIYPPIQNKNVSRTEARLLHHICQILNDLQGQRAIKLTIWAEPILKCLGLASSHHFVLNAVYAFSATLLAWETRSTDTRQLATTFVGNAMRGLDEALGSFSDANADALMAACTILPWLQNDWGRWSSLMNRIRTITSAFQQYHRESPFAEYLPQQGADSTQFTNETSFPVSSESRQERVSAVRSTIQELENVQPHLPTADPKWIGDLKSYIQSLHAAPIAQLPKEQFDNLYHVRKMLLWAPVGVIRSHGLDLQTLLLLSYFYASTLALEPAFPDIGAIFMSALVAPPLEEVLSVMQAFHAAQGLDTVYQMLLVYPRRVMDDHSSTFRATWNRPSISVSQSQGGPFELTALSIDLANQQLSDQYTYTPGLSPAFSPSTLSLIPPALVTHHSQGSSFLEVPSSTMDSFSYGSFTTSPASYHATTTSNYISSPLVSPGLRSPSDASEYHLSSYHQHSRQSSAVDTDPFASSSFEPYSAAAQSTGYSTNSDGVAGGCVMPTAVWT